MEVQTKDLLEYSPLGDTDIRLVRFNKTTVYSNRLDLHLEVFEINSAPSFFSLSYTWGDPGKTRLISINGRAFHVTENLHDALTHIQQVSSYLEEGVRQSEGGSGELFLWIDAICIDQKNITEKSRQVPRMTEIYTFAYTVLIWLGTGTNLVSDPHGLKGLFNELEAVAPWGEFPRMKVVVNNLNQYSTAYTSQRDLIHSGIMSTCWRIMQNEWFRRIWVVQEYALSRRPPFALLSIFLFKFRALYDVVPHLLAKIPKHLDESYQRVYVSQATNIRMTTTLAFGSVYFGDWIRSEEFRSKSLANQLLSVITITGWKHSTVPHDKIYGLLGMLDLSQLPRDLMPDYEQPFEEVFKRYTRFLITETKDLRFINCFSRDHFLEGQPSWVGDFRRPPTWVPTVPVDHSAHFSPDGEKLIVEGSRIGNILAFFHAGITEARDLDTQMQAIRLFHNTILTQAAEIRRQPLDEVWRDWLVEFVTHGAGLTGSLRKDACQYRTFNEFLNNTLPPDPTGYPAGVRDHRQSVLIPFSGASLALMENGDITKVVRKEDYGPADGHEVFAVKGHGAYAILRRVKHGEWRYAGWVNEFSPGMAYGDVVLNDEFFVHREIQEIILV